MINKFKEFYNDVFDENKNVKLCGREKCYALIEVADQIEPKISHGDKKRGRVYEKPLHSLRKKIEKKEREELKREQERNSGN